MRRTFRYGPSVIAITALSVGLLALGYAWANVLTTRGVPERPAPPRQYARIGAPFSMDLQEFLPVEWGGPGKRAPVGSLETGKWRIVLLVNGYRDPGDDSVAAGFSSAFGHYSSQLYGWIDHASTSIWWIRLNPIDGSAGFHLFDGCDPRARCADRYFLLPRASVREGTSVHASAVVNRALFLPGVPKLEALPVVAILNRENRIVYVGGHSNGPAPSTSEVYRALITAQRAVDEKATESSQYKAALSAHAPSFAEWLRSKM